MSNLNGLAGKVKAVKEAAREFEVDVSLLCETWLSSSSNPPFGHHISNITNEKKGYRSGGRKFDRGLLVTAWNAGAEAASREVGSKLGNRGVVLELNGTTVIFAYITPEDNDELLRELVKLGEECAVGNGTTPGRDVVICSDLNARSAELTGDHTTDRRGRLLEEILDHSVFSVQKPVEGKWTSFGRKGGKGITDVVLSTFPILDLRVHELKALGGSDHAPLTFSLPGPKLVDKHIKRWNVRKLQRFQAKKKYLEALEADEELRDLRNRCAAVEWTLVRAGPSSDAQHPIDQLASSFYDALKRAGEKSIGYLEWSNRIAEEFEEDVVLAQDRRELEEAVHKARKSAIDDNAPSRTKAFQSVASEKARVYRAGALRKRTALFHSYFDDLATNHNAG
ncbi:hypothetical protein HDU93_002192, partial [Gonapodya sp. JEL0774]